jgi:hypothetical protein
MKEPPDPVIQRLHVNVAASLWGSSAMTKITIEQIAIAILSEIKGGALPE